VSWVANLPLAKLETLEAKVRALRQEDVEHPIREYFANPGVETFKPMAYAIAMAWREGIGLAGTALDEVIERVFEGATPAKSEDEAPLPTPSRLLEVWVEGRGPWKGEEAKAYVDADLAIREDGKAPAPDTKFQLFRPSGERLFEGTEWRYIKRLGSIIDLEARRRRAAEKPKTSRR
jgi:hypothetical protein